MIVFIYETEKHSLQVYHMLEIVIIQSINQRSCDESINLVNILFTKMIIEKFCIILSEAQSLMLRSAVDKMSKLTMNDYYAHLKQ